ncbi:MAG: hypothetical protein ABIH38_04630 [Patescibacteria group bacterium]
MFKKILILLLVLPGYILPTCLFLGEKSVTPYHSGLFVFIFFTVFCLKKPFGYGLTLLTLTVPFLFLPRASFGSPLYALNFLLKLIYIPAFFIAGLITERRAERKFFKDLNFRLNVEKLLRSFSD